ncbi:helix-turn-helix domain-containing protein [Streptomyces sp. XM4193]|uniref:PucR family transcriptional regulator n=1 Tax=Streptomyces sp. XM4193 TaxID=2929782 RepID=UPI001FF77934|nr:PucR family transcriptional regulator [Streptomyces sp. XM4193]MCK1797349.1 helix-turn-helix domain-containing protein [Streptomyces sp. XM4193]
MSAQRVTGQLTVAQLIRFGPLGSARCYSEAHLDRQVTGVTLVSDLDEARQCEPKTAMVVHPVAAHGVWALEAALRCAWERNAACVVAPDSVMVRASTTQLAERLRLPLLTVADPARIALDMAVAIADTEAARARLISRCAVLFGERFSLRGIVGVINAEVPGVIAALVTKDGHLLAGRAAADTFPPEGPHVPAVDATAGDASASTAAAATADGEVEEHRVAVAVPSADGRAWATLVARVSAPGPSWTETVETILRLARAPLASAGAGSRLSLAHQGSRDRLLMETLLGEGPLQHGRRLLPQPRANGAHGPESAVAPEELARDAGWPIDGRLVAVHLRPVQPDRDLEAASPAITAAWREDLAEAPLVPLANGWATWYSGEDAHPRAVERNVRRRLASSRIPLPLCAGIGTEGEGMAGLRRSLREAELAAGAASGRGDQRVECYGELGPRAVLAALPVTELAVAARTLLAALLADPKAEVLLRTLAALLDCAGSTGQTATRLGVHRNTVLGRMERIRAKGIDLDSPDQRLALHVACHALLATGEARDNGRPARPL